MELSAARYIRIEGTNVTATVDTADEARVAIKEIRQKKREYTHIRKGLLREKKAAEKVANATKPKKAGKKTKSPGLLSSMLSTATKVASMAGAYGTATAKMDLPRIEAECARTEEILHNLDSVLIQMEGKLLRLS